MDRRQVRAGGIALNVALRAHIAYFLAEVLLHPDDRRFAGKAIPIRNLLIVGGMSLIVPLMHLGLHRFRRYPVLTDDLWLSVFWLDMAGNSFDLYDSYTHFDLIPHFHGTGAAAATFAALGQLGDGRAIAVANALHGLLELQEILTDVFFGTHNVRGWWDSAGDVVAGALGSLAYARLFGRLRREATPR
jgi:hypothetical protein